MKYLLLLISLLTGGIAGSLVYNSVTVFNEIEGILVFIFSAIFFVGFAIVDGISYVNKKGEK